MKKYFYLVLASMMLTSMMFVSCSKDEDGSDDKKEQASSIDEAQWKANLIGSWSYASGKVTSKTTITHNGSSKTGTTEREEWQDLTIGSGDATYTKKYNSKTSWDDGSSSDGSFNYTIKFTYEYVTGAYEFTSKAYLKGTVTESNNDKYWKVGDKFCVSVFSMTKNSAKICSGKDSHVDSVTFNKK